MRENSAGVPYSAGGSIRAGGSLGRETLSVPRVEGQPEAQGLQDRLLPGPFHQSVSCLQLLASEPRVGERPRPLPMPSMSRPTSRRRQRRPRQPPSSVVDDGETRRRRPWV